MHSECTSGDKCILTLIVFISFILNMMMRSLLSLRRFFAVRKYTKSHEWIEYFPERKVARVGISDYAQQQLGEIIHVELPSVGKTLGVKDSAAVIESVKIAADVYTPVSGKITAINGEVEKKPSLVNDQPDKSWLFEVSYTQEAQGLLTPEDYAKILD